MRDMYRARNHRVYTLSDFTMTATPVEVLADGTLALDPPITTGNATPGSGAAGEMAGIPGILVTPRPVPGEGPYIIPVRADWDNRFADAKDSLLRLHDRACAVRFVIKAR